MKRDIDGIYVSYLAGETGTSVLIFAIVGERVAGADVGGMTYEGEVTELPDGSFRFSIVYVIPPGAALITGAPPSNEPLRVPFVFVLAKDFDSGHVISLETPLGPVNAKISKLKDL